MQKENYLRYKSHPAKKSADIVRDVRKEKKRLIKENKILNYILNYYESLFPYLVEFRDEEIDDALINIDAKSNDETNNYDYAKDWLTDGEYKKLPLEEKYQLALERYLDGQKSKWQIGRAYERYIGYLYENEGYKVYYNSINKGFDDLGIDLICIKENQTVLVQCKYWSSHKLIHENTINQLYGTTIKYWIENFDKDCNKDYSLLYKDIQNQKIVPELVTSTELTETALEFAKALNVSVKNNVPLRKYPMIKCNISKDKEKIYHLTFDQQYDRILMNDNSNSFYIDTVKEAKEKGFRRAFRWHGKFE